MLERLNAAMAFIGCASKLGEVEVAKVCDLRETSMIVTDEGADPAVVEEIRAAGVDVRLATAPPGG